MRVKKIHLQDFRNYSLQVVDLGPGLHVFEGHNAQGKTALLEAVYLGATGRSFRTNKEADLIRWGQSQGGLQLEMERDSGRLRNLSMLWTGQERRITLQDQPVRKLSQFLSELPLALFTPDDLELVQGGPEQRRGYLDLLLCKLYPAYLEGLGRYQKVLRQKGALLKSQRSPDWSELDSWDHLLLQFGQQLIEYREQLCAQLHPLVTRLYFDLSGEQAALQLVYQPNVGGDFRLTLERAQGEELRRRTCLVGPHRDEVQLSLAEAAVRRFGSQGQRRTLALALRLAQAEILLEIGRERPVVLLDDCFSELDPTRQARLLHWLESASQVLITTATPLSLRQEHRHYRVDQGQVC